MVSWYLAPSTHASEALSAMYFRRGWPGLARRARAPTTTAAKHGQSGRLGGAMAGHHGLIGI